MRLSVMVLCGRALAAISSATTNGSYVLPTQTKTASVDSAISSTAHLAGDFIALGLGFSTEHTTSTALDGSSSSRFSSPVLDTAPISRNASQTAHVSTALGLNTTIAHNATLPGVFPANGTAGVDQCWNSWTSFWGELSTINTNLHTVLYTDITYTVSSEFTRTVTQSPITPGITTYTSTKTHTIDNNGFATSTYYEEFTYTMTYTEAVVGTTYTTTINRDETFESSPYSTSWSTDYLSDEPKCSLPTSLSQCDEAWTSWINVELAMSTTLASTVHPSPSCTQASIGSDLCQSLRDGFVSSSFDLIDFTSLWPTTIQTPLINWSGGYWQVGPSGTWNWPSTASFAPSCTLGCGRCSIVGGTVDLLYWPPPATATNTTNMNGTHQTTSAAVFSELVTTVGGAVTTLTSPSLYVSYHSLYAENACGSRVGKDVIDTIIAIPSASSLQSIWGQLNQDFIFAVTPVFTSTASFNVSDLYSQPVPMSIYTRQPWCAEWTWNTVRHDGTFQWLPTMNWTKWECPQNDSYKPIIKVPENLLRNIDPAWADCAEAYGGAYDPPSALTPVPTVAKPTHLTAFTTTTTAAQQAASPVPALPSMTSKPRTTNTPAETARPDQAESSDESTRIVAPLSRTVALSSTRGSGQPIDPAKPADPSSTEDAGPPPSASDDSTPPADDDDSTPASGDDGTSPSSDDDATSGPSEDSPATTEDPDSTPEDPSNKPNAVSVLQAALHSTTGAQPLPSEANSGPSQAEDPSPAIDNPGGLLDAVGAAATSAIQAAASTKVISDGSNGDPGNNANVVAGEDPSATAVALIDLPSDPAAPITIAGQVFTRVSSAKDVFANEQITFSVPQSATAVEIAGNGQGVVVGSGAAITTIMFPAAQTGTAQGGRITIAGQAFTRSGENVFENDQTTFELRPGSSTMIGGSPVRVASDGAEVIVGTGTTATTIALIEILDPAEPRLTIADQVFTRLGQNVFGNDQTSFTLVPGASTSVGGLPVRVGSNGLEVVVGRGSGAATITLPGNVDSVDPNTTELPSSLRSIAFPVDGKTHTIVQIAAESGIYILDGSRTVTWNGATSTKFSVGGESITLGASGLVEGGKTYFWSTATATGTSGRSTTSSNARSSRGGSATTSMPRPTTPNESATSTSAGESQAKGALLGFRAVVFLVLAHCVLH